MPWAGPAPLTMLRLVVLLLVFVSFTAHGADAARQTRLEELAAMHDMVIPKAWADLYFKQEALRVTRKHLLAAGREEKLGRDWNPSAPEWQAAEAEIVPLMVTAAQRDYADDGWSRAAWIAACDARFSDAELDLLLAHLRTVGGRHQAAGMDWFIAEVVMNTLTFTDRIESGVPGSEPERRAMERVAQTKIEAMQFDWTKYPETMRFSYQDPGLRYIRDVSFQMVATINARIDRAAAMLRSTFNAEIDHADRHIEDFKARRAEAR